MGYYIDLSKIDIDQYRSILESADLLPSRKILKEGIKKNFKLLKQQNIQNADELLKSLNSNKKILQLAKETNINEEYLTILVRETKSYRKKPINIKDFPDLSTETIEKLANSGIKNTLQLFDKILTPESRIQLSKELEINENEISRLAKLTDISRIRWVNHTFAHVLCEAGYDSTKKIADADFRELYESVKQLNEDRRFYKGNIGLHDMKLCVEAAKDVSLDVEF